MTRPHIEPYVELDTGFKSFGLPGFEGCDFKTLSLDPDNGACSLKVRFNNGFRRKPGLSYSDMELFVLGGTLTLGNETIGEGHYLFVPAGMALPALSSDDGCEALLFFNDFEPNWEESDRHHELTLAAGYISLNSYADAPWSSGSIVSPSTALVRVASP